MTAAIARALLRSRRRRRRAPRLASYLSRAGPGSRDFLAPTTRRRGGHLTSSASSPGSTGPGPHGRCQKAPHLMYIWHFHVFFLCLYFFLSFSNYKYKIISRVLWRINLFFITEQGTQYGMKGRWSYPPATVEKRTMYGCDVRLFFWTVACLAA